MYEKKLSDFFLKLISWNNTLENRADLCVNKGQ